MTLSPNTPPRTLADVQGCILKCRAQKSDAAMARLMLAHGRLTPEARDWLNREYPNMPFRIGTCHFFSEGRAAHYYKTTLADVQSKINAGEIKIGPPELKPGQTRTLIDGGARWAIIEPDDVPPLKLGSNYTPSPGDNEDPVK